MEDTPENCVCEHLEIVIVKQNGKLVIAVQSEQVCKWLLCQQSHLSHRQVLELTNIFCGHRLEPISCFGKDYISLTLILLHITKAALEEKLLEISTAVHIIDKFLWDVLADPGLERGFVRADQQENTVKEKMAVTALTKLSKSKQILGMYYIYLVFFINFSIGGSGGGAKASPLLCPNVFHFPVFSVEIL